VNPDKADDVVEAFRVVCAALKAAPWASCRALADAVHEACEEQETPEDVRDYIADTLGVVR
jgi:hypothetical protein